MVDPKKVFLPLKGLRDPAVFMAPVRVLGTIEPLIDGVETFATMERDLAQAERSVSLAMWSFDPRLPLVSKQQPKLPSVEAILKDRKSDARPQTWGELLVALGELDVSIRVLISDFDPAYATENHRRSWIAFFRLRQQLPAGSKAASNLEIIVPLHRAEVSPLLAKDLAAKQSLRIDAVIKQLNAVRVNKDHKAALVVLAETPGLWEVVSLDSKGRFRRTPDTVLPIRVASHHLKLCLIDGHTAFVGGLDPERGRVDTPKHLSRMTSWHDVHLRVRGPHFEDFARSFEGCGQSKRPPSRRASSVSTRCTTASNFPCSASLGGQSSRRPTPAVPTRSRGERHRSSRRCRGPCRSAGSLASSGTTSSGSIRTRSRPRRSSSIWRISTSAGPRSPTG